MPSAIRCLLTLASLVAPAALFAQANRPGDKVFLNARVVTRAREGDVTEAVAVRDGKIIAVGSNDDVRKLAGPETKTVDLAGKTLLPGFYAAPDHFPSAGRVALYDVYLNSPPIVAMRTIDDIV